MQPVMVPPGRYRAKAIASTIGISPVKATPYIGVTFEITQGEMLGRKVTWHGFYSEKTRENVGKAMAAMGYTGEDPEELYGKNGKECATLLPLPVDIVVAHEERQGQIEVTVQWVNHVKQKTAGQTLFPDFRAVLLEGREKLEMGPIPAPRKAPAPKPPVSPEDSAPDSKIPF